MSFLLLLNYVALFKNVYVPQGLFEIHDTVALITMHDKL